MSTNSQHRLLDFKRRYGPWGVVAGASEGLGAAYAYALAERGLNLCLVARRESMLQSLQERLIVMHGIQVQLLPLDLSRPEAAGRIAEATSALEVGLLVYNAAFSAVGPFLDRPLDHHLKEIDTNVRTPLGLVEHFGQRMRNAGRGGILLMTSLSAFQGSAYISTYSATKAFNLVLAEGLWEEWRRNGVDVLACVAGATRTPNYLASAPQRTGGLGDATLPPEAVVTAALKALGRQPFVIPGRMNRLSSFVMRHLMPRRTAVSLMGSVLRGMYVRPNPESPEVKA